MVARGFYPGRTRFTDMTKTDAKSALNTTSSTPSVGIIGFGQFGSFLTEFIPANSKIWAYDPHPSQPDSRVQFVSFEECCRSDIILLAIPLAAYPVFLDKLAGLIKPQQLVIDICSVKTKPQQLIDNALKKHPNLLMTHPLFGRQSYKKPGVQSKLIVTEQRGSLAGEVLAYLTDHFAIDISEMSAEEHDKMMATIHAVTFCIARGLANLQIPEVKFTTPSYKMILDLVTFDTTHSEGLFETILLGNPFASDVPATIAKVFSELDSELQTKRQDWLS